MTDTRSEERAKETDVVERYAQAGEFKPSDKPRMYPSPDGQWCMYGDVQAELTRLRAELERERMRVVACGVVAMSDTPESAAKNRDMHEDYKSASCDDVARRVDECIRLRAEVARLTDHLRKANSSAEHFEREWYLRGDEIERLEAEKAEAVKDAERYRWLRDTGDVTWTPFSRRTGFSAGMADTAIDAAMRGDREDG